MIKNILKQSIPTTFRLFMGIVFLIYGLAKFWPGQFGDVTGTPAAQGKSEGFILAWKFFGYSRLYELFIGTGEIVAAILVMIPVTATLGAIIYLPIAVNITMINFCYQIGVGDLSLVLTLMCLTLLWLDRKKLIQIFFHQNDLKSLRRNTE